MAIASSVNAQDLNNYRSIQASGKIPTDVTTSARTKYETAEQNLDTSKTESQNRDGHLEFLLESNFVIDQVLGSGRVLFNDSITIYLNQVLDVILIDEPNLREEIRVYAVQSSVVNSFTTHDGIILVNLGLIAQLENEAQLAFILCHELTHFTEKHVFTAYLQNEEFKKTHGVKQSSFDEKLLEKSRYSKDLEKDADEVGLRRFLKIDYSTEDLLNVFEVMRFAHLPFDDIPFAKDFFNREYYKINDSYFLNRVRPVEAFETEDASLTTHPSPTERQRIMSSQLASSKKSGGTQYVVSENQFKHIRDVCRFELSNLYLKSNRPVMSIYNSFLLLESYPNNSFLKRTIASSLYTLSKFKTGGNYGQVHPGYSQIEGESQQAFHLFYRLKPEELAVLAAGYVWNLKHELPEDKDLKLMAEDLLQDLMYKYYVPGMFSRTNPPKGWDQPDTTQVLGKYERLKEKSKDNPRLTMIKFALVDLFDDPEFSKLFDKLEKDRWGGRAGLKTGFPSEKQNSDDVRYWKNHGFSLGAKKVVVVSPTYAKLDLRKNRQHKYLSSESAKSKLTSQINRSADLLNLEVEIIDQTLLDSTQVDDFNDITFLNEWVDKRFTQLDVSMVNLPSVQIEKIIEKYGTEYFVWTGIINYRENKPLLYYYLLYALVPPAIPLGIYYMARPNFETYYYCITFNLRTGQPVQVNYNNYRKRDARDLINSSIYDSFWQMKRPPKKKAKKE